MCLAAAVAKLEEEPFTGRSTLEEHVEEFLQPALLAQLMAKTKLMRMGTRQDAIHEGAAAQMLLALVGASKVESGMFCVLKLWQWLAQDQGLG